MKDNTYANIPQKTSALGAPQLTTTMTIIFKKYEALFQKLL